MHHIQLLNSHALITNELYKNVKSIIGFNLNKNKIMKESIPMDQNSKLIMVFVLSLALSFGA